MIHYDTLYDTLFHTVITPSQQRLNIAASAPPSRLPLPRAAPTFVGCAHCTTATSLDWMLSASRRHHAVHLC